MRQQSTRGSLGGECLNAVPEKTEVKVEWRSQTHEKCLGQSNLIKQVFLAAAESVGTKAETDMELLTKCYHIPEDAEFVKLAKEAIRNPQIRAQDNQGAKFSP
ncbi:MAG: hypothetical protein ACETVU_03400 [Desulfatiglandales bacterium]